MTNCAPAPRTPTDRMATLEGVIGACAHWEVNLVIV